MSNFTLKKEDHIQYIIDNFDFNKVSYLMTILDWKWYFDGNFKVPSEKELKIASNKLLNDVYDRNVDYISSGGLKASKCEDFLMLEFVIENSESLYINLDNPVYDKIKKNKTRKNKINNINTNQKI